MCSIPMCECVAQVPAGYLKDAKSADTVATLEVALRAEDFVVAIITHSDREHMLMSSRLSRQV